MALQKSTDSSSLAEVIDRILDKGIVIDAFVRVSVVGIEILTVEARVVIASVDTWLRYAEAVGLLRDGAEEDGLALQSNEGNARFSIQKSAGAARVQATLVCQFQQEATMEIKQIIGNVTEFFNEFVAPVHKITSVEASDDSGWKLTVEVITTSCTNW